MCIFINSDKCNIAEEDIVTYKVLFPTGKAGMFCSIIKYFRYIIGKTYTEPDMEKTLFWVKVIVTKHLKVFIHGKISLMLFVSLTCII